MRKTKATNPLLRKTITDLKKASKKNKINLWNAVAANLSNPSRKMASVNISKLEEKADKGEIIIIPGKVLGMGELTKKITVAAWKFSESAFEEINKKGEAISIEQLIKKNPKANKVRIFK